MALLKYHHYPVIPPVAEMYCPVIHRLLSDTIKSTTSAISSTVPNLSSARVKLIRNPANEAKEPSGSGSLDISVATGPGATLLTVIPWDRPNYTLISISRAFVERGSIPLWPKHSSDCPERPWLLRKWAKCQRPFWTSRTRC